MAFRGCGPLNLSASVLIAYLRQIQKQLSGTDGSQVTGTLPARDLITGCSVPTGQGSPWRRAPANTHSPALTLTSCVTTDESSLGLSLSVPICRVALRTVPRAAVLILPPMKLNSQLSGCAFFFKSTESPIQGFLITWTVDPLLKAGREGP